MSSPDGPVASTGSAPAGRSRAGTGASGPVRQLLGPALIGELEQLCGNPTIGLLDVVGDVTAVVAAAVAGSLVGHLVGPLLAVVYIGVRQRHLSNLAHEAVHTKLLRSRRGNRLIGYLLTGLLGEGLVPYRVTHSVHHAFLGSDTDPMFQSYRAGRLQAEGQRRPGRAAFVLRVIVRGALWRLPVSAVRVLVTRGERESWAALAARALVWAGVAAACWPLHAVGALLLYWLVPLVLVRPVVTWITDLGNHAGLIEREDLLTQTRGWSSHWLTRHLLGGHLDDQYHPVHHLAPKVPWRRLPEARALLAEQLERWPEVPWCSGYFFRRRSTPDVPCVIEDVIDRLAQQYEPARPTLAHAAA